MPYEVESVVRRIKWLLQKDGEARVLVFSSWAEVLEVLAYALAENGIRFAYAKSGKALALAVKALKDSSDGLNGKSDTGAIQALLLPLKQGANGLNLTEAQHVILVEPLLDPAVEAQAISRVHRIGQQKKTFIHNFVVNNSVEQNVFKLNRERASTVDVSAVAANRTTKTDQSFTVRDVALLLEKSWTDKSLSVSS